MIVCMCERGLEQWEDRAVYLRAAVQIFCAPKRITKQSASILRKLLSAVPQDQWLGHFLGILAEDGKTKVHTAVVLAHRDAVPGEVFFKLVTRLGCTGGDATVFARELARLEPARVDLAILREAVGLECESIEWLLANLAMRSDVQVMESTLAALFARFFTASPVMAAKRLACKVPLTVQVRDVVVEALASVCSQSEVCAWLTRVLEEPALLPHALPPAALRMEEVVHALIAAPSIRAQIQGITALVALKGVSCLSQIDALLASTTSPLLAQVAKKLSFQLRKQP